MPSRYRVVPEAEPGWRVLAILSGLMGFASISTDFYLPAMPTMARALRASNTTMEITISGFLIGFSLGQLFWGPIGDRYGRRMPVAIGLVMFILGSAGCALCTSAWALIGWRVVQAVGACACVVLSRAMVRDLYAGDRSAKMLSTLMTVMAVAPLLGPILGGQILAISEWRAIFWTLVCVGVVTLVSLRMLPETLSAQRRNHASIKQALRNYVHLAADRRLMGFAGAGAFFYGGTFAYIAGSPFVYIDYFHVPAQLYGLLFGAGILAIMVTSTLNARLVMRFGAVRLMRLGAAIAAGSGVLLALDTWTGSGGLAGFFAPMFLFVGATGLVVANAMSGALAHYPQSSGAVSALLGALQYGMGIVGSSLVSAFDDHTPWPVACVVALAAIGSLLCAWSVAPTSQVPRRGESCIAPAQLKAKDFS